VPAVSVAQTATPVVTSSFKYDDEDDEEDDEPALKA